MKKTYLSIIALFCCLIGLSQQRIFTKTGKISFFSKAPLEDIEAHNNAAISVIDNTTGQMEFSVLMKGFQFEKALMQEHFNENYVESTKFPKASFKGTIADWNKVDLSKDGKTTVNISGQLTIHGETKEVKANAIISVTGGSIGSSAEFSIILDDYKISIPALVKDKIAKNVLISVNANYEKM